MAIGIESVMDFGRDVGATVLKTFAYYAVIMVAERLIPAQPGQKLKDMWFNFKYLPFYIVGTALLLPPLTAITVGALKARFPQMFGLFPADSYLSAGMRGLAYLLIFDFFYYWFHRLQHTVPVFWLQHKLHHSDPAVNVTTTMRHHWLEEPLRIFFMTLPMAILFDLTPAYSAAVAFALSFWGFYIHANLAVNMGPLNRFICSPQVHRLHHSLEPQHQDKNLAAIFSFYDVIFGTYAAPVKGEFPRTGLSSGEQIDTVWKANFGPFADLAAMLRGKTRTA